MLGRSGTGKSILLKLIIGLEKPDAGSIRVHGQGGSRCLDLDALNAIRKKMGFLFQHAALYDSLSVEQNIAFPLRRHTKMTDSERGDRVKQLLSSVGMESDLKKMPSDISPAAWAAGCRPGARVWPLEPDIPLLDEPTRGPRSHHLRGDRRADSKVARGSINMASIVVTHDLGRARKRSPIASRCSAT